MAYSLLEHIPILDPQHGPLVCFLLFVFLCGLGGMLPTGIDEVVRKTQAELLTLWLLLVAYFVGFTNTSARPSGAPKVKLAGSRNALLPKNTPYEGDSQTRHPVRPAGRLASQIPRGATGAPRIPRDAGVSEKNHEAIKKIPPMTASEQLEVDTQILSQAQTEGIASDASTYSKVMGACSRLNNVEVALDLYSQILQKGVPCGSGSQSMSNHTVSKFFRLVAENLDEKRMKETGLQLLDTIQAHRMVPTNAIQNCLICAWRSKLPDHVLAAFMKLREQGVSLSSTAYRCIMAAHERTEPERTLELFDEMVERGVKLDRVAYNAALCACSHLGMAEQALELFEKMPEQALAPSGKTYGALIRACTATGKMQEAVDLFDSMREAHIEPNQFAYHDTIQCCVRLNMIEKAMTLYQAMIQADVPPCDKTCLYLGKECQRRGWTEIAVRILQGGANSKTAQSRGERARVPPLTTGPV
ncbi:unnamed protein product [Prorocentrum cordatum]|uniref:PROP1-like PPR domain-containing protein n=1 Tax=Prorocentrum cordatum TaxID=2364126 RepID=A0ABN9XL62_9DINO|nr:unnamed protein product [Polarella glacialis]